MRRQSFAYDLGHMFCPGASAGMAKRWVGCTSFSAAICCTVLRPLSASKAIRALNSALWIRLLFFMSLFGVSRPEHTPFPYDPTGSVSPGHITNLPAQHQQPRLQVSSWSLKDPRRGRERVRQNLLKVCPCLVLLFATPIHGMRSLAEQCGFVLLLGIRWKDRDQHSGRVGQSEGF
jgi:hypothetical protein